MAIYSVQSFHILYYISFICMQRLMMNLTADYCLTYGEVSVLSRSVLCKFFWAISSSLSTPQYSLVYYWPKVFFFNVIYLKIVI